MGELTQRQLYSQRRIHSTGGFSIHTKGSHIDRGLEVKILAKNIHFPLAPLTKQDPNLG
jgi:hypothetical protein